MSPAFTITSPAFADGGVIPSKYTCDGDRTLSPPLLITGVPEGTRSVAVLMDDPDIPTPVKESRGIESFDHWILFNIPAHEGMVIDIPEGGPLVAALGLNSAGHAAYTGPCPPPEYEPREHRYIFTACAISDMLVFHDPPTRQQVIEMVRPLLIGQTHLVGRYARQ